MKYAVRINKRVRYLRAYTVVKRVGENQNLFTKLLIKVFNRKKNEETAPV